MRTKILIITVLTLVSFSLKSQSINDTNVIFYDYNPDFLVSNQQIDSLNIDINQDGVIDLKFYVKVSSNLNAYIWLNNNCYYALFPLNHSDTINTLIYWRTGDQSLWDPSYEKFAIKITLGNDNYYGWIHANLVRPSGDDLNILVDKYSFCKIPNYSFLYGQTSTITSEPIINLQDSTNIYLNNSTIVVESNKIIHTISLINSVGATVFLQSNLNTNNTTISTSNLAHGTYIVKVQFSDQTFCTKKIVI